ncbi:uncharacterized protein LOC142332493 [Lycorma delicatula]|uniref:uncharacterized protein LOC142332493 n=1 Tax=Lycorma delicatula TaxID=130591 RepID=UPI003F517A89
MLTVGEMCLILPNIRSNCSSSLNRLNYLRSNFKKKTAMASSIIPRCLFGNSDTNNNDNDYNKKSAEKLLDEQLKIDRERFLIRFNFDILSESNKSINLSSNKTNVESSIDVIKGNGNLISDDSEKIRLDDNVNIEFLNREKSYNNSANNKQTNTTNESKTVNSITNCKKSSSPIKTKTSTSNATEFKRRSYVQHKKQTHLTDFWKINRRSSSTETWSRKKTSLHLDTSSCIILKNHRS